MGFFDELYDRVLGLIEEIGTLDGGLILLAVLIVCAIIVLDRVDLFVREERARQGLQPKSEPTQIDGSRSRPVRDYISELQLLSGRPDAIVIENSIPIPVERKPLTKKLHDRHVAQLLVYMRLVEEFEGKRPPYGYLILGSQARRITIYNTDEKQAWLDSKLKEMREILRGEREPEPAPDVHKCARCSVRDHCAFKVQA